MPSTTRRDHIIEVAIELFGEHGFHATGVDTIIQAAQVSKKTLYKYFRSKDELILACLQQYDGLFRNNFMRDVERRANTPKEQLLAIFDTAEDWFNSPGFYGCLFVNVVGEFSGHASPMREISKNFKQMMRRYIFNLCEKAKANDSEKLADEIALLLEGAIASAQVTNSSLSANTAKRIAESLLKSTLPADG